MLIPTSEMKKLFKSTQHPAELQIFFGVTNQYVATSTTFYHYLLGIDQRAPEIQQIVLRRSHLDRLTVPLLTNISIVFSLCSRLFLFPSILGTYGLCSCSFLLHCRARNISRIAPVFKGVRQRGHGRRRCAGWCRGQERSANTKTVDGAVVGRCVSGRLWAHCP
jgi:hypothetical protein